MKRKVWIGLLILLILIQFIRPARNIGEAQNPQDITHVVTVDESTMSILKTSCYDCHSNATNYPWYANINPIGLWLANHVNEGKKELNFSQFANYDAKRKVHKLEEIVETVQNSEMPLPSYLWVHGEAKLTDAQKKQIIDWANAAKATVQ